MAEKVNNSRERALLESAMREINYLRRHNEQMAARLDMFDRIDRMINADLPRKGGEYHGPDICETIEKFLAENSVKAAG